MGVAYRRKGGGTACVDAVTAAAVVGGALLLQFLFYGAVNSAYPTGASYLGASTNTSYVINVNNSNTISMQMTAGNQDLMQSQNQMQTLEQMQMQTQSPVQSASQTVAAPQMQEQAQSQFQRQDDFVTVEDGSGTLRKEDLPNPIVGDCEECVYLDLDAPLDDTNYPDYLLPPWETGEAMETGEAEWPSEGNQARSRQW